MSVEAEKAFLGAVLLSDKETAASLAASVSMLTVDSFVERKNAVIFSAIVDLYDNKNSIDEITILAKVEENHKSLYTDSINRGYLAELVSSCSSPASMEDYAKLVFEGGVSKKLTRLLENSLAKIATGTKATDIVDDIQTQLTGAISSKRNSSVVSIKEALVSEWKELQERIEKGGVDDRIPTGFMELDNLGGLAPGNLVILAARPGMGKTALALNIATNIARDNLKVCVFSLEMSRTELVQRVLSSMTSVPLERIITGGLYPRDMECLGAKAGIISKLPLWIDDSATLSARQIYSHSVHQKATHGLDLVIIDYLQLIHTKSTKDSTREAEVAAITRQLKLMAKELGVPVIALAQLNRGLESREDKRPRLSDLRESGAIEQDADKVIFLYREGYYNKDKEGDTDVEAIVSKSRNGGTGTAKLKWHAECVKFT